MTEYWKDVTTPQFEGEIWKDIPGYEGEYQVSNLGRVKGIRTQRKYGRFIYPLKQRIMKQHKCKRGYCFLVLTHNSKEKTYSVHSLVMLAFVGERPKDKQIDHKDTNPSNNKLENLHYVTTMENRHNPITVKKHYVSVPNRRKIVQYDLSGNFIQIWQSISLASESLNVPTTNISKALRGQIQRCGGYQWRYYDENNLIIKLDSTFTDSGFKKPVIQYTLDGDFIKRFDCIIDASNELNICDINIIKCCKSQRNSAGGFKWSYA